MSSSISDDILDDIYEAAVVPERWPFILDRLSIIAGAEGGALFATDLRTIKWLASPGIAAHFDQFVKDGWMDRNPRPRRLAALRYAGFITDHDVFTDEEMDREPVYVDALRKMGLGWGTGTMFAMPSGDLLVFSFERAFTRGPVQRKAVLALDGLRPHLGRAGLLAWRFGLQRARAMADALEEIGMPTAVLRESGRASAVNTAFGRLIPQAAQDRRDRLTFVDAAADAMFADALGRLTTGGSAPVQSIPLRADGELPPMVVHLLPVRRSAQDIFHQAAAIAILMPIDRANVPTAEMLEGLFDLTPAEARAARAIGEGKTIGEIAIVNGLSEETVRSQVKAALSKTGLRRQAELVALLAGVALPHRLR